MASPPPPPPLSFFYPLPLKLKIDILGNKQAFIYCSQLESDPVKAISDDSGSDTEDIDIEHWLINETVYFLCN